MAYNLDADSGRPLWGNAPFTDLMFYERSSGTVEFYSTSETAAIAQLGTDTTSTNWTAITTCELGRPRTALFCYDRTSGSAQFYSTDGHGHLATVGAQLSGLRRGWTDILAGNFGGGGASDLLLFDRESSEAQLCSVDQYGALNAFADLEWDEPWTHVVAGNFTSGQFDDLVFYDAKNGTFELFSIGSGGNLISVARVEGLRHGWTHLCATGIGWNADYLASQLFAYDRATGEAAWYIVRRTAPFVPIRPQAGWPKSQPQQFAAHYASEADPSSNAVLAQAVAAAAASWTGAGNPPWTLLTSASAPTQQAVWAQAVAPGNAAGVFDAAQLPAVADPAPTLALLGEVPGELVNTLQLPNALANQIVAGSPAAAPPLKTLVGLLRAHGVSAALPLVIAGGSVIVLAAVAGLPQAGLNLAEQPSTGFRWYDVPIAGVGGSMQTVGAQTSFLPGSEGLSAVVALGYARVGLTDPYEWRPELPEGSLLSSEYEFLMNLLELATPVGVRVNTYAIRKQHVDLDGNGHPDELDPSLSRTYRAFRRRRHLGQFGVPDET